MFCSTEYTGYVNNVFNSSPFISITLCATHLRPVWDRLVGGRATFLVKLLLYLFITLFQLKYSELKGKSICTFDLVSGFSAI